MGGFFLRGGETIHLCPKGVAGTCHGGDCAPWGSPQEQIAGMPASVFVRASMLSDIVLVVSNLVQHSMA